MNQLLQWLSDFFRGAKVWALILPWERGVRIRAGKHTRVLEPGFHPRIPFIDEIRVANTRLRIAPSPRQSVAAHDGQVVAVCVSIGFRITDPLAALLSIQSPETWCSAFVLPLVSAYVAERAYVDIRQSALEAHVLEGLQCAAVQGLTFEWARVVDFCPVRVYRLMNSDWLPSTNHDQGLS